MKISEIYCYPIKSLSGVSITSGQLTDRGLLHDRRWMIVDEKGKFLTQRQFPEMALLQVEIGDSHLVISHKTKDFPVLQIPFQPETEEEFTVQIWGDTCSAIRVSNAADEWISNLLGAHCRLVFMPEHSHRQIDLKYTEVGNWVNLSDGYPYLIIGQASMDFLNSKLEKTISILRFRPNFVFTGGQPHEEDLWSSVRIGAHAFRAVKPCARCQIPSIDQETAIMGKEPNRTLATYRRFNNKVLFGMNLMGPFSGEVAVGDLVHGNTEPTD